ncbi:glycoside hydrolase family 2 [Paenibacillus psychroresistens]|uniref:Glycoside hydrolase family 2 n=1 Tax=Paenibacillus psychroresistens TaxID=1778678 RepID=A0A6B8RDN6_9BACL|nr:sugar-binding domain-containing protein [Paenibacillus psychroresistens]QGQ94319.1 glycoside hydrolase family 2 [Paenibacillus psychroresistens]
MSIQFEQTLITSIPRPEYPRPDWQRADWLNLNGAWSFQFDPTNQGKEQVWFTKDAAEFSSIINVPFSWTNPLSGIASSDKGVGWYNRAVKWQPALAGERIFLRFGAVDYISEVWVNGTFVGSHQGGYGTFEFDVTAHWLLDSNNSIVVRAEDYDHSYQTRGKQGYGEIRGIWQTVWLEARSQNYVLDAKFTTHLDGRVEVVSNVIAGQASKAAISFSFADKAVDHTIELDLVEGSNEVRTSFVVANPQLWSPESPFLYEGEILLNSNEQVDSISTYFGIREISTTLFEDRSYRWITLNNKPIYLNGTLDQSFHPEGYFTYPTDQDMHDEIFQMKRLGLNFVRIHIKPEEPRKLYWADKLGLLVMEDMPCFWGNPDEQARTAYENEARELIERDFNHPSIFSWIIFNETWGLKTDSQAANLASDGVKTNDYLPETQEWVRRMYHWVKQVDPTRLVEDNSPCNYDHVETDINTWHFYINGYEEVRTHVTKVVDETFVGSTFNYIGGNVQTDAPLMNSECGNVWGMEFGTGDSDLAWHYRYMMNEFRRHDKMCGFVFTEFRDVLNEFNGYHRIDGSDKQFGYEWFVPDMQIADLHTPDFIVIDAPPCQTVEAGAEISVPLLRSSYSDLYHGQALSLNWELWYDNLGIRTVADAGIQQLAWDGYGVAPLEALSISMPNQAAVAILAIHLTTLEGTSVTRNFITFDVRDEQASNHPGSISVAVTSYVESQWEHSWHAIQEHKVSGGPIGHFAYEIQLPDQEEQAVIYEVELAFEAGAKYLMGQNKTGAIKLASDISFMHGANADPEYNKNSYLMTDAVKQRSNLKVWVDDELVETILLPDDPADSRGVLSWHYQPVNNQLNEAGSYGYLCKIALPSKLAAKLNQKRSFKLVLEAEDGGLALYGRNAGRYPIDLLVKFQ